MARQKELQKSHKSAFQKKSKTPTSKLLKTGNRDSKNSDTRSEGSVHDSDSRYSSSIIYNTHKNLHKFIEDEFEFENCCKITNLELMQLY